MLKLAPAEDATLLWKKWLITMGEMITVTIHYPFPPMVFLLLAVASLLAAVKTIYPAD